jgi:hypothetical protein
MKIRIFKLILKCNAIHTTISTIGFWWMGGLRCIFVFLFKMRSDDRFKTERLSVRRTESRSVIVCFMNNPASTIACESFCDKSG